MAYTINMDKAGRLVVPKVLRERYGLGGASHGLELVDTPDGILMRPKAEFLNTKRTSSGWMVWTIRHLAAADDCRRCPAGSESWEPSLALGK